MPSADLRHCDVAIVGLGPVGITLASLLAKCGHDVVGLDAALELYDKPRAISLDHETLRTWQSLGVADPLAPFIGDYRPTEYRAADGSVLRRMVALPEPYPLAWPPNMTFVQPDAERVLREAARLQPTLEMRLGARVTRLDNDHAEPGLTVQDVQTGAIETIRARYVVACDGATSSVRKSLAIASEDLDFDEPWLVVDVLVDPQAVLPEIIIQQCDPTRPTTYVRGPGRLRRWEFMLLPGDDPAGMVDPLRIRELLRPWLDPDHARIWRAATYRFHALVAERWRVGSVLLAGDAAHQTPPFIGQGLNQGIRDAANLAWKISAVLAGAPVDLLDTYEAERRPNVRAVIAITKELGRLNCERDPIAAAERNHVMLAEMATGQGTRIRQSLLPPIRHGLIAWDAAGEPLPGAGEVCPQPWIETAGECRRLDDVVGSGFRILMASGLRIDDAIIRLATAIRARIVRVLPEAQAEPGELRGAETFVEADRVLTSWMAERQATALVVRPDHIVYGTARDGPHLVTLLQSLLAAATSAARRKPS